MTATVQYLRKLFRTGDKPDSDDRPTLDLDPRKVELVRVTPSPEHTRKRPGPEQDGPPIVVHLFWAYGDLSPLERLSCASFVSNGFSVRLWTYNLGISVPRSVEVNDAREIVPEAQIFTYKNGSYAGFANLFRYAVLLKHGGLWADTDVICLAPVESFRRISDRPFFVTEATRNPDRVRVNNNLIYLPAGAGSDLLAVAHSVAASYPVEKLRWGDTGPRLLTGLVSLYPELAPRLMEPEFGNPVEWWNCPQNLNKPDFQLPNASFFLHCYNEMWRRAKFEKTGPFAQRSVIHAMVTKYGLV